MNPIHSPCDGFLSPEALGNLSHYAVNTVQQHITPIVYAAQALTLRVNNLSSLVETRPPSAMKRELDGTLRPVDAKSLANSLRTARYALRNLLEQFQSLNTETQHLVRYQPTIYDEGAGLVPLFIRANWHTRQVNKAVARARNLSNQQIPVARYVLDTIDSTRRFYSARASCIDHGLLNSLETLGTL
jgi:hypothetical protein